VKKDISEISNSDLIEAYKELKSSYKVADKFNLSATAVKRVLKELGALRAQNVAAQERGTFPVYERTDEHRANLSNLAKQRSGEKHPCFGKPKSEETRKKISDKAKTRYGELNANYRHGRYERRPRDFKLAEFKPVRNFVFNRDNYSCHYCETKGGHLHAHHKIPFWAKPEAFLDVENLVTVCSNCHLEKAHLNNWNKFDVGLIDQNLAQKYNLDRERLNELATFWVDAIVRPSAIDKTEEPNRND
jgi:5-methylcytosine-specific restriction endonuclease McrA